MDKNIILLISGLLILMCTSSNQVKHEVYPVTKLTAPPGIDARWDKLPWSNIRPLSIDKHMGSRPEHKPKVQAKIGYDNEAIYIIFRVEDRYVCAVATDYQGRVYEDSCVEFFFTPGNDVSRGYFNLEMNCGGTALFSFQKEPRKNIVKIPENDFEQIEITHSLPSIVDPEIQEPITWTIEYRLPFQILEKYFDITRPAPGVSWRANFYKCADKCSFPHWLTWSYVDYAKPNFHLPEFFGILTFME